MPNVLIASNNCLEEQLFSYERLSDVEYLKKNLTNKNVVKALVINLKGPKFLHLFYNSTLLGDLVDQVYNAFISLLEANPVESDFNENNLFYAKPPIGSSFLKHEVMQDDYDLAYWSSKCLLELTKNDFYICHSVCKYINDSPAIQEGFRAIISQWNLINPIISVNEDQPREWLMCFMKNLLLLSSSFEQENLIYSELITNFLEEFSDLFHYEFYYAISSYYSNISLSVLTAEVIQLAYTLEIFSPDYSMQDLMRVSGLLRMLASGLRDEENSSDIDSDTEEENLDIRFFSSLLKLLMQLLSDEIFITNLISVNNDLEFEDCLRHIKYDMLMSLNLLECKEVSNKLEILHQILSLIETITRNQHYNPEKDFQMCILNLKEKIDKPYSISAIFIILTSILQSSNLKCIKDVYSIELSEYLKATKNFQDSVQAKHLNIFFQYYILNNDTNLNTIPKESVLKMLDVLNDNAEHMDFECIRTKLMKSVHLAKITA